MTLRQQFLHIAYPWLVAIQKWRNKKTEIKLNSREKQAITSFYSLQALLSDGSIFSFSGLRGKNVLIVNGASDCGYTRQYAELEQLYREHKNSLEILCFPANDFRRQEKGSDSAISEFCKVNYGISFFLFQK